MAISGKAVTITGVGVLLVWSGIRGASVLGTVKDMIAGVKPSGANVYPLTANVGAPAGQVPTPGGGGNAAAIGQAYVGHAYLYGGAPGRDGSQPWDCSSFVNYVVGVKMGDSIPGYGPGKYIGTAHGPATGQWGVWPGLAHIDRSAVMAGDIVVWLGHMGICIDQNTMVSALDEADGTKVTPIDGYGNGPLLCYGRLT